MAAEKIGTEKIQAKSSNEKNVLEAGGEVAVVKPKVLGRVWRLVNTISRGVGFLLFFYFLFTLIGLVPVNNDYRPANHGVDIWVISNAVHADLVLPVVTNEMDWSQQFPPEHFQGNTSKAKYVLIGWGDRGFFIETQTWSQLKVSTAANALLLPSETCMHVVMSQFEDWDDYGTRVKITREQYQALVAFVKSSFKERDIDPVLPRATVLPSDQLCRIENESYGKFDAFYEAEGTYHCFNTCNSWIGRALQAAGVKVGWATPLPKTVYFYLPEVERPID